MTGPWSEEAAKASLTEGMFWRFAGVSVTGFSHEETGSPCEDHHAIGVIGEGWLVGVVADGAGSAQCGGEGSRLASLAIYDSLTAQLLADPSCTEPTVLCRAAIEAARTSIRSAADAADLRLRDFHTTVVAAVVGPATGFFFQIGDGAAVALHGDLGEEYLLSTPENGAYADTTYFITEDEWLDHLRILPFDRVYDTVILMSDGVTPMALRNASPSYVPVAGFLEPISRYLAGIERERGESALAATLSSDRVRDITGDDKTLVWASRAR